MASFKLNKKQQEAVALQASPAREILLRGGSRSAKTTLNLRSMVVRALKAPGSRHAVLRFRFVDVKRSICHDSFPKVMTMCFPDVQYHLNKSDWFAQLPGGSEIWFGGLDDKERTDKILGNEYATIFLNEVSQISYDSYETALTRLAQLVEDTITKKALTMKMYLDENPPDKGHWSYKQYILKVNPKTNQPIEHPELYASMQLNPIDNRENLPAEYISTLEGMSERKRKRFLLGEFRDANPNALFIDETLEKWRERGDLPEMLRIVIAVDPSGADDIDNAENDAIGISVAGLGINGVAYVLYDHTIKAGPATWARVAVDAYKRNEADRIVGEDNFGGAMVQHTIRSVDSKVPYRKVHASRGKTIRAEPIAALFEQGKIRLAGEFRELEEELAGFTTHGYVGDHSPNRADAMIWAMYDLFPDLMKAEKVEQPKQIIRSRGFAGDWQHTL